MTDGEGWRAIFGHEQPYEPQIDGIEAALEAARDGGYLALEGACGTGKTMLALTAGLHLVRDPDSDLERVVVLTSVKQQLRQFEQDLRTINDDLPEDWRPFSGVTLVGKPDVCPYSREHRAGIDETNVYDRCESLRDRTRDLVGEGGATTADALVDGARRQQVGLEGDGGVAGATYLETADEPAPYAPELPEYEDPGAGGAATEYCPFYAQYLADLPDDGDPAEAVPFDVSEAGLLDPEDVVALSVRHGTCPHSMLGAVLGQVEVVVGNYYHAFDPTTTAAFTAPLIDDSTFVICDEAHMLEPRVRDLVSDGVADATLRDAATELDRVLQPLQFDAREGTERVQSSADADLIRGELADTDVGQDDLERARAFLEDLREELDRRVTAHLDREHRGWRADLAALPDDEIPLRDPETPQPDELSEWAEREGYDAADWTRLEAVAAVVERILDHAEDEEKQRALPGAARTLAAWQRCDHETYFREIRLERGWDDSEPPDSWRRAYTARLELHNCVPGDVIGERLAEFGGGVLMSATLEPLDVFAEVTGLDHLEREHDRPVLERTYGLHFPRERRASFAVAAPKFTHDNRGRPATLGIGSDSRGDSTATGDASGEDSDAPGQATDGPGEENPVRRTYADAIRAVARSPGNVLVGMPSYAEAEWAAAVLEDLDKPVLLDESSADDVTEDLKERFFAGPGKVLVTSLRGTLTEGVDYRGDRLAAAVVCGVPIVNTASPRTRAIRTAYDDAFDGQGFEYALTVPAVRKARQALGRVIRAPEEVGVRVLVDERYARDSWDSVREYLPTGEEFRAVSPDMLEFGLQQFWDEW